MAGRKAGRTDGNVCGRRRACGLHPRSVFRELKFNADYQRVEVVHRLRDMLAVGDHDEKWVACRPDTKLIPPLDEHSRHTR
jgi:hypothetical protein